MQQKRQMPPFAIPKIYISRQIEFSLVLYLKLRHFHTQGIRRTLTSATGASLSHRFGTCIFDKSACRQTAILGRELLDAFGVRGCGSVMPARKRSVATLTLHAIALIPPIFDQFVMLRLTGHLLLIHHSEFDPESPFYVIASEAKQSPSCVFIYTIAYIAPYRKVRNAWIFEILANPYIVIS